MPVVLILSASCDKWQCLQTLPHVLWGSKHFHPSEGSLLPLSKPSVPLLQLRSPLVWPVLGLHMNRIRQNELFFFFLEGGNMEVPRLGVESELQLPTYARATATWDPSRLCDLYHSSQQHRIPDPLSKARDRTHNLMVTSRIPCHSGNSSCSDLNHNSTLAPVGPKYEVEKSLLAPFRSPCLLAQPPPSEATTGSSFSAIFLEHSLCSGSWFIVVKRLRFKGSPRLAV